MRPVAATLPRDEEAACRALVELVTEYLEGTLSPGEQARFEAHVSRCPGCSTYVGQLRQLFRIAQRLGRGLDARALTPATRAALLDAYRGYGTHRNGTAGT